ncbi:MAG: Fic family protein, partial [Myxococcales bacterium]|nr:Fic family protein [Myxococcales bacterium]
SVIPGYPLGETVPGHLDEFFAWYGANYNRGDPVAFAAEAQRRFVSIHPFVDGNGRTSRLLMDNALQRRGLPPALLHDTEGDLYMTAADWTKQVRGGVVETWRTAARHGPGLPPAPQRGGDLNQRAARWGALGAVKAADKDEAP